MEPGISTETLRMDADDDEIQREVFEKWMNFQLEKRLSLRRVRNLFEDLRDGEFFIAFLEALTGDVLPRITGLWLFPAFFTYWRRRWNVEITLDYLDQQQVNLRNVAAAEIVSGNRKVTLCLIGKLVAHYEIHKEIKKHKQRMESVQSWLEEFHPNSENGNRTRLSAALSGLQEQMSKVENVHQEAAETLDCFSVTGWMRNSPRELQNTLSELKHLRDVATLYMEMFNIIQSSVSNSFRICKSLQEGEQLLLEIKNRILTNLAETERHRKLLQSLDNRLKLEQELYEEMASSVKEVEKVNGRARECAQSWIIKLGKYKDCLRDTVQRWERVNGEIHRRLISLEVVSLRLRRYEECYQKLQQCERPAGPTHGHSEQNNQQRSRKELELLVESGGRYVAACEVMEVVGSFGRSSGSSQASAICHPHPGSGREQLGLDCEAGESVQPQESVPLNGRPQFRGLRRRVTIEQLLDAEIIDASTAQKLEEGEASVEEVSRNIRTYLEGSSCVAGVLLRESNRKLSIFQAMLEQRVRPGTGILLLEAQAATGFMVDPVRDLRLTVHQAVRRGLVSWELMDKLLSAERAVTGYTDPDSGALISLFQAMKKGLIVHTHALRLLEAQVATGGIIDPQHSHRVPVEAAYRRGLFDRELHATLSDPSDDTKGFFDPNTQQNLTYLQLTRICVRDPGTGLLLLPLRGVEH
ncbi:uncharacterized protein LOC144504518 isoform X2 [Mustelus asterias]